jgi:hypothetical protein
MQRNYKDNDKITPLEVFAGTIRELERVKNIHDKSITFYQ